VSRPARAAIVALALALNAAITAPPAAAEDSPMPATDPTRFDELWDYEDPAGTEVRFRGILPVLEERGDASPALQLRTQIARTLGLQRRFDEAHALLDTVATRLDGAEPVVRVRYLLERGRVLNSSGRAEEAKTPFVEAWDAARACGEDGFAVDAAHMVAIVETPDEAVRWNGLALQLARTSPDPRARKWKGSLLNNLAWTFFDQGDKEQAHALFLEALAFREEAGSQPELDIARWCVARSLRGLGRVEESLAAQRALQAEKEAGGRAEKGFVPEEIGECLLALGRADEARPYFAKAAALLSQDPWLVADDAERLARLARLADPAAPPEP